MKPNWQKLASLAHEICTLWFQFFGAVFASKGYPFKNIFVGIFIESFIEKTDFGKNVSTVCNVGDIIGFSKFTGIQFIIQDGGHRWLLDDWIAITFLFNIRV